MLFQPPKLTAEDTAMLEQIERACYARPLPPRIFFFFEQFRVERFRTTPIYVKQPHTGHTVYMGPPPEQVPELMEELYAHITHWPAIPVPVFAAMAHLNLVMIHPYPDKNGARARVMENALLWEKGYTVDHPVDVPQRELYYDILYAVGGRSYSPQNDAGPWVTYRLRGLMARLKMPVNS